AVSEHGYDPLLRHERRTAVEQHEDLARIVAAVGGEAIEQRLLAFLERRIHRAHRRTGDFESHAHAFARRRRILRPEVGLALLLESEETHHESGPIEQLLRIALHPGYALTIRDAIGGPRAHRERQSRGQAYPLNVRFQDFTPSRMSRMDGIV